MNDNHSYYSYRLKLEKLKQKTWVLVIVSRVLFFLILIVNVCLRRP
jgi:hypothetical protein